MKSLKGCKLKRGVEEEGGFDGLNLQLEISNTSIKSPKFYDHQNTDQQKVYADQERKNRATSCQDQQKYFKEMSNEYNPLIQPPPNLKEGESNTKQFHRRMIRQEQDLELNKEPEHPMIKVGNFLDSSQHKQQKDHSLFSSTYFTPSSVLSNNQISNKSTTSPNLTIGSVFKRPQIDEIFLQSAEGKDTYQQNNIFTQDRQFSKLFRPSSNSSTGRKKNSTDFISPHLNKSEISQYFMQTNGTTTNKPDFDQFLTNFKSHYKRKGRRKIKYNDELNQQGHMSSQQSQQSQQQASQQTQLISLQKQMQQLQLSTEFLAKQQKGKDLVILLADRQFQPNIIDEWQYQRKYKRDHNLLDKGDSIFLQISPNISQQIKGQPHFKIREKSINFSQNQELDDESMINDQISQSSNLSKFSHILLREKNPFSLHQRGKDFQRSPLKSSHSTFQKEFPLEEQLVSFSRDHPEEQQQQQQQQFQQQIEYPHKQMTQDNHINIQNFGNAVSNEKKMKLILSNSTTTTSASSTCRLLNRMEICKKKNDWNQKQINFLSQTQDSQQQDQQKENDLQIEQQPQSLQKYSRKMKIKNKQNNYDQMKKVYSIIDKDKMCYPKQPIKCLKPTQLKPRYHSVALKKGLSYITTALENSAKPYCSQEAGNNFKDQKLIEQNYLQFLSTNPLTRKMRASSEGRGRQALNYPSEISFNN